MIKSYSETKIHFEKELNILDKFTLDVIKLLGNIKYVIVSGYVAIFFGRTRATEDIDFLIEPISFKQFKELVHRVKTAGYWFINGDDMKNLYEILKEGSSLRIAKKGLTKPNAEIKFSTQKTDYYSMRNRVKVIFDKRSIYIGQLELQIAFKLYLGSEKDIEDARHLYGLFEKYLDKERLTYFVNELGVENKFALIK